MAANDTSITEDEIMAGLTEEERAALAEPDDDDTTNTGETTDDNDQDGKKDDGTGGDGDADGAAVAGKADAQQAGAAAAADDDQSGAKAAKQPEDTAKPAVAPVYVAQAPADADDKLKAIAGQKAELRTKYEDGDITFAEYEEQKDTLSDQEAEIKRAVDRAQLATEMETQRQKNQWDADCNTFLADHDEYSKDEAKFNELNETVKVLAVLPSNKALTGPQLLAKAHRIVSGEAAPKQDDKKDEAKGEGKAAQKDVPKPNLPPNLGKVPAAAATDTGEGRFAALDRLAERGGMEYEKALAALSESEREAYLRA